MFTNITFAQPWFFLLFLVLPAAGYFHYKLQNTYYPSLKMPTIKTIRHIRSWKGELRPLLAILRTLAFGALVLAMAKPQKTLSVENIKGEGIDIFMAIDLSRSMLAQDFKPDRLRACQRVAIEFVDKRRFDRIGLAVFAGEAFTMCPLTTDHSVVKEFIASLRCGFLEDGTAIGDGLATAVNHIKDSQATSKIVILLTDGVNNSGYVAPLSAGEIAKEFNVKIYAIGVGTQGQALMPVGPQRSDGSFRYGLTQVEIDETLLTQIADLTGGKYFRASNATALERIYAEIDRLEKSEIDVTSVRRFSEEYWRFVLLAAVFLFSEAFLRYTVFRYVP